MVPRLKSLALIALVLGACASPQPTPTPVPAATRGATPSPQITPSPAPEVSGIEGRIAIACDDPLPGHCLQLVAYAVRQLPSGHAPISAVTATSINLCPSASPCIGPPHRGESWVTFSPRDGGPSLEMWIVDVMGTRHVQELAPNASPPPSLEPATASFPLTCGSGMSDVDCTGAAAGATARVPAQPLRAIRVVPPLAPASCPSGAFCPAEVPRGTSVVFTFVDGSGVTVAVARDASDPTAWVPVSTP